MKSSVEETGRVVIVIRSDCDACEDVVQRVSRGMEIFHQKPRVINLDHKQPVSAPYNSVITPAIYIDKELWAYGTVDQQIIAEKLQTSFNTPEAVFHKVTSTKEKQ
ncbi:MAG: hypothetical protein K9N34_10335 [Candidatus Marinimicrobia bacterium]|nr:hypothetical protein [Candidatus Neomarinimicrobiota bacterium]MCF7902794.1 hypothetical protein [Candidatus Neomarinimicrobiota bacterium]